MTGEDEAVAAVVKKHTGHDATSVEKLNPGPWLWFDRYGDDSATYYSVRCVEREYVVRVPLRRFSWGMAEYGLTDEYHAVIGRHLLDALCEAGQGAPIVYAVDRDCDFLDRPCAVSSRVPGRPWRYFETMRHDDPDRPPEERREAPATGQQMGTFVRALHNIRPLRGFGPLTDDGVGLVDSWSDWIGALTNALAQKVRDREAISGEESAEISAAIGKWAPECEIDEGRALWMDDIMFGLLVDATKRVVTGVSHAAAAWSGDPDYELEWFAYYDQDTGGLQYSVAEFAEGYGRPYDEQSDKRCFYRMSCYLAKLSWLPLETERAIDHRRKLMEIARMLA